MREKHLSELPENYYNLIIVGGGIHGATLLSQAAKIGLRACLIEKNDFCGATSANSLKIIHGGFRYLQHGNIKRMRESIESRKRFLNSVPHLINTLSCVLPTPKSGIKSKPFMRIALKMNDLIGFDRNKNVPEDSFLTNGKVLSREEFSTKFPNVQPENYTGGAMWFDTFSTDTERTTMEFILDAVENGAHAVNYTEVKTIIKEGDQVKGVMVVDQLTGNQFNILGDNVVLAVGPWLNEFLTDKNELK